jgi:hypothetical protein
LKHLLLIPTAFLSIPLAAQTAPSVPSAFYAESFHRGTAHIVEDKFDVKLSSQDSTFHEHVKDSHGDDRYNFAITPEITSGDTTITSWLVKLSDLRHGYYGNLLLALRQDDAGTDPLNQLWRLNPSRFAIVPATARRIIKVEDFYVVLQIKTFHFKPPESPYLDSMTVAVEFTNTDPRTTPATSK